MTKSAVEQLIEMAEHLTPSGEIGDGTVFRFHELAALARIEGALAERKVREALKEIEENRDPFSEINQARIKAIRDRAVSKRDLPGGTTYEQALARARRGETTGFAAAVETLPGWECAAQPIATNDVYAAIRGRQPVPGVYGPGLTAAAIEHQQREGESVGFLSDRID